MILRVIDFVLVLPTIPLVIVISAYTRPSLLTLSAIIAVTSWPGAARVIRAQVLTLRDRSHIRAAVGFGASTGQVLRRHVLPESGLILVAIFVRSCERAIAFEAAAVPNTTATPPRSFNASATSPSVAAGAFTSTGELSIAGVADIGAPSGGSTREPTLARRQYLSLDKL